MKRILVLSLFVLLALVLSVTGYVVAQGDPTPPRIWLDVGDGTQHPYVPEITSIPTSTSIIQPTDTAVPSETPFPTPTIEPPIPTATPGPTLVPPDLVCYGTVTANSLNVRETPGGTWKGSLTNGQRIRIFEIEWVGINLWAHIFSANVEGWSAVYFNGDTYIERDQTDDCDLMFELTQAQLYPPLFNKFGLHIVVGSNADLLVAAVGSQLISSIKATDSTEDAVLRAKIANPNLMVVWRELKNGPDDWCQGSAEQSARNWYAWNKTRWTNRGLLVDPNYITWFEYRNELIACQPWEVVFDLWMVKLAEEDGICLAVFSDAYGTPSIQQFVNRRPVLDYILSHPCKPGRWHAVAKHDYEGVFSGEYKMGRWKLYLDALGHGAYDNLTWLVTEYGINFGYAPTDCVAWNTDRKLAEQYWSDDPEILVVHHWNFGGANWGWHDITECIYQLLIGELPR